MATLRTGAISTDGRTILYTNYVMIIVSGGAFITTPLEHQQVQKWAKARMSSGVKARDRMVYLQQYQTVLAKRGAGIATRGNTETLTELARNMKADGMSLADWVIPPDVLAKLQQSNA